MGITDPFPYPLHIIREEGGELEHHAWLAAVDEDNQAAGLVDRWLLLAETVEIMIGWRHIIV